MGGEHTLHSPVPLLVDQLQVLPAILDQFVLDGRTHRQRSIPQSFDDTPDSQFSVSVVEHLYCCVCVASYCAMGMDKEPDGTVC